MRQFLLVYRRSLGELLSIEDLGSIDPTAAMRKRFDVEMRWRRDRDVEVVVLSAPSQDALKRTHSRYFRTSRELAAAFADAAR
jgi:hypothetical protein